MLYITGRLGGLVFVSKGVVLFCFVCLPFWLAILSLFTFDFSFDAFAVRGVEFIYLFKSACAVYIFFLFSFLQVIISSLKAKGTRWACLHLDIEIENIPGRGVSYFQVFLSFFLRRVEYHITYTFFHKSARVLIRFVLEKRDLKRKRGKTRSQEGAP
jgi:hypothetical protein